MITIPEPPLPDVPQPGDTLCPVPPPPPPVLVPPAPPLGTRPVAL